MEIKLSKNGWHRKIQTYVFNNPPMYHNFCPYFWLTNFCIVFTFLIPIVPVVKLIGWLLKKAEKRFDAMSEWMDKNWCQPQFDQKIRTLSMEDVLRSWVLYEKTYSNYYSDDKWEEYNFWANRVFDGELKASCRGADKMLEKFNAWKTITPDWENKLEEYKNKRIANREAYLKSLDEAKEKQHQWELKQQEKVESAKQRRQQMFSLIAKYTKWLVYIIVGAIVIFILHLLYMLGVYMVEHFNYVRFVDIMMRLGIILLALGTLVLIILIILKITSKVNCNVCISDSKFVKFFGQLFSKIWNGVVYVCVAIGKFFTFFWEYIITTKKDYCPGINWTDDKNLK